MGKRANNEGTIFQLPDGTWCGFVSLGYRGGKRWRKKFKAKTQREVKDKIAKLACIKPTVAVLNTTKSPSRHS